MLHTDDSNQTRVCIEDVLWNLPPGCRLRAQEYYNKVVQQSQQLNRKSECSAPAATPMKRRKSARISEKLVAIEVPTDNSDLPVGFNTRVLLNIMSRSYILMINCRHR